MFLPSNLKFLLSQKKIRKSHLAKEINVSAQMVGNYVSGQNQPKIETLIRIAKMFNVNIDDLLLKDLQREKFRPFTDAVSSNGQVSDRETDRILGRVNELLERRVAELERELKRNDPDLAKDLGIE